MTTTMTDLQTGHTHVFNEALPGRDAYEEALALGFVGSRAAWLAHLRGFAFDPASADWEVDRAYAANAAVRHDHKVWVAVVADTGTEPGTDPAVWQMLLDGAPAQDLTDAVAAALAHKGAAQTAAADAETKRGAAATILTQTQEAAQALSPIEALHPTAIAIPAGWWDTGDRLLSGVSERAIIANWQFSALGPSGLWRGDEAASLFADTAGLVGAGIGDPVAHVADSSGNSEHMVQAVSGYRPLRVTTGVQFDQVDDGFSEALAAGAGCVWVAGPGGLYVVDTTIAPGGTLALGGTAQANAITGGPRGILRAVSGGTGVIHFWGSQAAPLTEAQISRLERRNWGMGGKGLLVAVDVSPSNGGFDTDTVWTKSNWTITGGKAVAGGGAGSVTQPYATTAGHAYLVAFTVSGFSAGSVRFRFSGAGNQDGVGQSGDGTFVEVVRPSVSNTNVTLIASGLGFARQIDTFTIHRMVPREEL